MKHTTSTCIMAALVLSSALSSGCTRSIEMMPPTAMSTDASPTSIASTERVPLILDQVKVSQNGAPQNPSTELDRRLLGSLQSLKLFSHLSLAEQGSLADNEKAITAHVTIDDAIDSHPGEAAWKGFAIGTSMFLLAPVMDFHYDYGTHLTLELERWDGTVKTYQAESSGTARYNLFSASPSMIAELKGHVMEAGITDLMNQLVKDATFYNASSAPMSERTIHTVSVKSKRRGNAAVSVSTSGAVKSR
ncbi:MAG: hypothetical protein K2X00_04520 [Nitrospiraceae bacterium]|nr:hypothetical protein [Nitrospiraceae bacterium]OQW64281.1 MAG: hypothetical protein BVN29_13370 [Nitrospira sp. ST-bin5]